MPYDDESAQNAVSRETDEPVSIRLRTAGDIASFENDFATEATPLAAAAEHTLLARGAAGNRPPLPRPASTRVIVSANQKGGVGKTTSTVNIAAALAQLGQKVLVIDLDPQGNACTAFDVDHYQGTPGTYEVLVEGASLEDVVVPVPKLDGLELVPATIDLAGAEVELVEEDGREQRLKEALARSPRVGNAEDRWDYVLIDCPPSLGLLTVNALVASTEVMIPIQAEYYALEGLGQLLKTVEMVRAALNPTLKVSSMLITMYDARTRLASQVAEEVREHFRDTVMRTFIPRAVRVSEAPSFGQTVMTYDPGSPGALSYLEAAKELAKQGEQG